MSEFGEKLIAEVRKVAERNPDHVYAKPSTGCVYVSGGQPSCIVGHALWNLGSIDANMELVPDNTSGMHGILDHLQIELDSRELDWLIDAQNYQDTRGTWSQAIWRADNPPLAYFDGGDDDRH